MPSDSDTTAGVSLSARGPEFPPLVRLLLTRMLSGLEVGRLTIVAPSGARLVRAADRPGPEATIVLRRWAVLRKLIVGGDVGFAEAYVDGAWTSPDLPALLDLVAANASALDRSVPALAIMRTFNRLRHGRNANSKAGSRRNIAFHYDLGNGFYRLWLDAGMTYSSALYARPEQSLEEAQAAKLERIVELLDLRPGDSVLEIGCGWGALAARLARAGARVTGVTLSSEQLAHAREMLATHGLADRVEIRLQDYREVEGSFDRIVSIEMLEAVGEAYWPTYFQALQQRLKPGAKAVLQVITIHEDRFAHYRRNPDFIQRYVFPGGMLPTPRILGEQAARAGLRLVETQTFGRSYALTLADWRRRFLLTGQEIERQGFGAEFRRLWEYYLCYCEAGFRSGSIDVGFYVLAKP